MSDTTMQNPLSPVILGKETITVDFKPDGNAGLFKGTGWHGPEVNGCWTNGPEARLRVPAPGPNTGYHCRILLSPFLIPDKLPAQQLIISADGHEIFRKQIDGGGFHEFDIPASVIGLNAWVDIILRCPNTGSPRSFGASDDSRPIAFLVDHISFEPRQPTQAVAEALVLPAPHIAAAPEKPAPKVAAVTMCYNEREFLPIWLRHYGRHVGLENCFVVDHGSTDGSTDNLGPTSVVRIPRSPYDPAEQSRFNSRFCSSLLSWYDWVIYADVDEIILPDPKVAPTLREYCRLDLPEIVNAVGLNIIHRFDHEPPFDFARPVTEQRPYVFGASSMYKPNLIHRPVEWSPGSHSSDAPFAVHHLYMFHLRWFDLASGLRRLKRTREMAWINETFGTQARIEDEQCVAAYRGFATMPTIDDCDFDPRQGPIRDFTDKVRASTIGRENDLYKLDLFIWGDRLLRLPQRFIGTF